MSEGILPEMDEQETLGQIIDKIGSEQPDLAEAIRLCAIPHWFNKEILGRLRGERGEPSERTETILDELKLKRLAIVRRLDDQSYILHGNVRNLMLSRWRHQDAERFRELNEKTGAYYADMLNSEKMSEEQRAGWEREEMYHLLVADQERGIDHFISLSNRAIDSFRLSTLNLLLGLASEQTDDGSAEIQLWIQFFEGKRDQVSSDWGKALEEWERLREERAFFTVNLEKTLAVHLSILYKDMGEWKKAIECLDDSLNILEREGDERGMITILNNRGYLYKDREHFQKAENDFQRALEVSKKIGDDRGMAVSLTNLGLLYKANMKWDEALAHLGSSLAVFERIGDGRGIARAYDDRALVYKDRGLLNKDRDDLQKAENDFQRAHEILDEIGDEHEKAAAFNSLGLLYKDRGLLYKHEEDLEKAENAFQRAREILEGIGDQRRIADIFNYLGFLHTATMEWRDGNAHFQRALTNFQEALRILTEMGDERGTAVILNNLGLLYQRKGDNQPAVDYFQQSLSIVEKIGDEMNASTTMYELALLYDAMEKYDKAIELLEKVLKVSEGVGHPDPRIRKSREKLEMVKAKAKSRCGGRPSRSKAD